VNTSVRKLQLQGNLKALLFSSLAVLSLKVLVMLALFALRRFF
jgi:hypothetical protein